MILHLLTPITSSHIPFLFIYSLKNTETKTFLSFPASIACFFLSVNAGRRYWLGWSSSNFLIYRKERNSFLKRLANVTQIFYICISVISGMNSTKLNPDIKVFFFQLFLLKSYWVLILFLSYCKLFGYCIFGCKYNLVYICVYSMLESLSNSLSLLSSQVQRHNLGRGDGGVSTFCQEENDK